VLDLADVAPYLIDKRLISARAVVDGGLRLADVSRINRVFVVTAEGERCLVLKRADDAGSASVVREAAVLDRLWSVGGGELTAFLPRVVAYDDAERVLILETAAGARNLTRQHAHGRFSRALAAQVGRALAGLHDLGPSAVDGLPGWIDPTLPLRVHQPDLTSLHEMSVAAAELTAIIQSSDGLCAAIDALVESWRSESTIHGDVRWDNCLAMRQAGSDRWVRLHLIDWEVAGAGDPGLDIGAFFAEYLRAWLQSIPIANGHEPGRLLAHAARPLRRMRPALGAFWEAYVRHRSRSESELTETLYRATRFAAAGLLSAALEEAQMLSELPATVLFLVPLSQNILTRPDEASAHLLGLKASWDSA
jgi:aminoglycoside phosphotransferase (APT) family kinase protein